MSIPVEEMKRVRDMMTNFLYAIHGYGVSEVDFTSVKREQNILKIQGFFKKYPEKFEFIAEFDNEGRLLSYERVKK